VLRAAADAHVKTTPHLEAYDQQALWSKPLLPDEGSSRSLGGWAGPRRRVMASLLCARSTRGADCPGRPQFGALQRERLTSVARYAASRKPLSARVGTCWPDRRLAPGMGVSISLVVVDARSYESARQRCMSAYERHGRQRRDSRLAAAGRPS
jgi:hypothetical protein